MLYEVITHSLGLEKGLIGVVNAFAATDMDGQKYLYYEDQHFHVFDVETGTTRNITEGVPTSFIDVEDDHNIEAPPIQTVNRVGSSMADRLSVRGEEEGSPSIKLVLATGGTGA